MELRKGITGSGRRAYFIIGFLCFALLAVLATVYYRERILFSDTAYQLAYLLFTNKPYLTPIRFGAVSYQLITVCAFWAHCDLKTLLIVDSLAFIILSAVVFMVAYRFSQRSFMFFLIPLMLVLFANDVFYWPVPDTQMATIWLSLYAVFLFEDKWNGKWWAWPVHFVCIMIAQMAHLLAFLPLVFLVVYYYGSISRLLSTRFFIHLSLCLIAVVIRYQLAKQNAYEGGKLDVWQNLAQFRHFFGLVSVRSFAHKAVTIYSVYIVTLLAVVAWLFYTRRYVKALAVAGVSLAHWVMCMLSYPAEQSIYMENLLMPLGFVAALPMVADIIPAYPVRRLLAIILVGVLIRVGFIYHTHYAFTERLAMYDPYIRYAREKKLNGVFVSEKLFPDQQKNIMLWASGFESILLSAIPSPDSMVVVHIQPDVSGYSFALKMDTTLVTSSWMLGQSQIPAQYFKLRKGGYEVITDTDQLK